MDSMSFTKLYSQAGQFPFSINLSTPSFSSSVVWMCRFFRSGQLPWFSGCTWRTDIPSPSCLWAIWSNSCSPNTLTLGLNTLSQMSEYALFCLNCSTPGLQSPCEPRELSKTLIYFFLPSYLPWVHGTTFNFAKDPYSSFWGRKCRIMALEFDLPWFRF